jgi:hypothetical protein
MLNKLPDSQHIISNVSDLHKCTWILESSRCINPFRQLMGTQQIVVLYRSLAPSQADQLRYCTSFIFQLQYVLTCILSVHHHYYWILVPQKSCLIMTDNHCIIHRASLFNRYFLFFISGFIPSFNMKIRLAVESPLP